MIKKMSIGPYVLNGSNILFMKRNPVNQAINIYFDNYEFILTPSSMSIKSLFNVCGTVGEVKEGQFNIFVTDEKNECRSINSTEPNFASRIIDLF